MLWKTYSAWLFFCVFILFLTNGIASITLVIEYHFFYMDILFTYGFFIFLGVLEVAILAGAIVLVEVVLERAFKRRFDLVFRAILISALVASWALLLQVVLTYVL